jgi:hypothetical protein
LITSIYDSDIGQCFPNRSRAVITMLPAQDALNIRLGPWLGSQIEQVRMAVTFVDGLEGFKVLFES